MRGGLEGVMRHTTSLRLKEIPLRGRSLRRSARWFRRCLAWLGDRLRPALSEMELGPGPSAREVRRWRAELEVRLAEIHFEARMPL